MTRGNLNGFEAIMVHGSPFRSLAEYEFSCWSWWSTIDELNAIGDCFGTNKYSKIIIWHWTQLTHYINANSVNNMRWGIFQTFDNDKTIDSFVSRNSPQSLITKKKTIIMVIMQSFLLLWSSSLQPFNVQSFEFIIKLRRPQTIRLRSEGKKV